MPRPKLRRRPFGYKAADVDEALEARESELAELRQDVAALWLAFAQHDRMIRTALNDPSAPAAAEPRSFPSRPWDADPPAAEAPPPAQPSSSPVTGPSPEGSIGRQLSDLDDVLAAIELATQTLERTYADEIDETKGTAPPEED